MNEKKKLSTTYVRTIKPRTPRSYLFSQHNRNRFAHVIRQRRAFACLPAAGGARPVKGGDVYRKIKSCSRASEGPDHSKSHDTHSMTCV